MKWLRKIVKQPFRQYGKYKIYLVNGPTIRNTSLHGEEFSDFGTAADFEFVPKDEIWVENDVDPADRFYDIEQALDFLHLLENGVDKDKAYERSIRYTASLREKYEHVKHQPHNTDKEAPKELYVKELGTVEDGKIKVFLVNGRLVRDMYKTDFVLGGHGYVYPWVPNDEIWIDNIIDEEDVEFTILHELTELRLMRDQGISYEKAHTKASQAEFSAREKENNQLPGN